jgi:hypothetical protein
MYIIVVIFHRYKGHLRPTQTLSKIDCHYIHIVIVFNQAFQYLLPTLHVPVTRPLTPYQENAKITNLADRALDKSTSNASHTRVWPSLQDPRKMLQEDIQGAFALRAK